MTDMDRTDAAGGRTPGDPASGLGDLVGELTSLLGVLGAALFDRSGRVVAASGFDDRDALIEIATLTAGLGATGAEMGRIVGDSGLVRTVIEGSDRTALLAPVPARGGHLILLVCVQGDALDRLGPRLREIATTTAVRASTVGSVDDPRAFEASLFESLDRLFSVQGPGQGAGRSQARGTRPGD